MEDLALPGSHWLMRPNVHRLGRARAAVLDWLRGAGVDGECRERAVIACDELLVNAIMHVGRAAVLSVCIAPEHVRVAVTDPERIDPLVGWRCHKMSGLTLVGLLSRALYVEALGDGKTVAAEIARRDAGARRTARDASNELPTRLDDPGDRRRPGAG